MNSSYTAVIKQADGWWIGWIQEVRGVNAQAATREELLENLRAALADILELNSAYAISAAEGEYEVVNVQL